VASKRRIICIAETCSACPSQWEGLTSDGQVVYIRYRWGNLYVGIGDSQKEAVAAALENYRRIGDEYDGTMSTERMMDETERDFEWGRVPSPA